MSESGVLALADPTLLEEKSSINLRFGRRTWSVIGAVSLLAGILGMVLSLANPDQFVVTRSLLVMSGNNPNDNAALILAFEDFINNPGFATELKSRTDLDLSAAEIRNMISTDHPVLSATIDVKVTAADLDTATAISDQVVPTLNAMVQRNQRNLPIQSRIAGPIVQEIFANPIREQVFVPWWVGLLTGAGLAFLASFVVAAFRHYRQPVINSARDVGSALDLPVLARISVVGDGHSSNPQESVLAMMSAVERLGARGPIHRLVVVGPDCDLERSKLILALGCAIARNFDQPVALVDADLKNASLTRLIGASDEPGLSECLTGEMRVDQTLLRLENGHTPQILSAMLPPSGMVRVMPAGIDRGGSLLRMRSNLHQVLTALSGRYVVVIDGPQIPGPVPSTQLLSLADATLVVVTEGSTSIRDARFTGDTLRSYTTNPVGAVVLKK